MSTFYNELLMLNLEKDFETFRIFRKLNLT